MVQAPNAVFLGRIAVDLYGEQFHSPLEETRSFARYPGGSSGNMAIAAARAGATVGLISAVGNDPMGRYLMRSLRREGIDTRAMTVNGDRRTALAFLGMLNGEADQLDFYRANSADACIEFDKIPTDYFMNAQFLALTGTHVADAEAWRAASPIVDAAEAAEVPLVLDIDLRRSLWSEFQLGLEGSVARVRDLLPRVSIVVGNEEEIALILSGDITLPADVTVVRKLGPNGARWSGADAEFQVAGHKIDVVNPVGAGDAFLGNLTAALLVGASPQVALARGNAAGALVATRHGCATEMPYPDELDLFLDGVAQDDPELSQLHRAHSRPPLEVPVLALACDHREPFDELVRKHNRPHEHAQRFKNLVFKAMRLGAKGVTGMQSGMLMDPKYGQTVLDRLADDGIWTGRPIEVTGSRPLICEAGHALAQDVASWRPGQVAKVLVWYSPDDPDELRAQQIDTLKYLQASCHAAGAEWMLELVPPLNMPRDGETLIRGVSQCYETGLRPDWWKLPALTTSDGWTQLDETIREHDDTCRGVIVLGLNEPADLLEAALRLAGKSACCQGFAIGRTIFGGPAESWFSGDIDDAEAVDRMAVTYKRLIEFFLEGRSMK